MLILGIDDAGRGPLIGPMILAGVLIDGKQEQSLRRNHIRDSKTIPVNSHRIKLSDFIKLNSHTYKILKTYPEEIDFALHTGTNLNTLEAIKTAEIINEINQKNFQNKKIKVIIDCPSNNVFAWRKTLLGFIKNLENLEIHCEHKADANHISVAAASILAKVTREEEIEKIRKKYGEVGSGYPADPITKKFLKDHGKEFSNEGIFRKSWSTWKNLFPEKEQLTLGDF